MKILRIESRNALFKKGQAMVEYVSITALLFLGLFVGGSATPYFRMMIEGFSAYLKGIMYVLNFPLL